MAPEPFEFNPEIFGQVPLFAEIAKAMSWTGGPINWDMARQVATAMASSEHAPPLIDEDTTDVSEAARLAESWLAEAASYPADATPGRIRAVTPRLYVESALSSYAELLDPLGGKLSGALSTETETGDAPDQMTAVIKQIIPLFLGIQCGSVLGALSRSLLAGYDVPVPVEEEGGAQILLAHVDAHARELSIDRREMRYWAVLHASAHRILYDGFPWTRAHFWSLYHGYLAAIDVNLSETLERLQMLDISSPEQLQSAIGDNLFGLGGTSAGPAQERLQGFIALVEAATHRAIAAAAAGKLVAFDAIEESLARRSAEGERALEKFLGTEVPAAVAFRARSFCDAVIERAGWPALNAMWENTDNLPTDDELADPDAWFRRTG